MLRIFLAVLFTLAAVDAIATLAPNGQWLYIAELVVAVTGFTALLFVANDRKVTP